eukprot:562399_1
MVVSNCNIKKSKKRTGCLPKPSLMFNGKKLTPDKLVLFKRGYMHDGDVIHWWMTIVVKFRHKRSSEITGKISIIKTYDNVSTILRKFKDNLNGHTVSKYPDLGKQDTYLELFYNTGTEVKLLNGSQTLLAQLGSIENNFFFGMGLWKSSK